MGKPSDHTLQLSAALLLLAFFKIVTKSLRIVLLHVGMYGRISRWFIMGMDAMTKADVGSVLSIFSIEPVHTIWRAIEDNTSQLDIFGQSIISLFMFDQSEKDLAEATNKEFQYQ